ncbi:protein inturned [Sesbania bispinosa]|nr:protein inturned [Sesbania bispinosa]
MKKISQKASTEKGILVIGEGKRKRELTGKELNVSTVIELDTFPQNVLLHQVARIIGEVNHTVIIKHIWPNKRMQQIKKNNL